MATIENGEQDTPENKAKSPTSKLSIAALVFGILTIWPFRILAAIPAVICGHLALRAIKSSPTRISGAGYAKFGLIVGYLDIVIFVVAIASLPLLAHFVLESFQQIQSSPSSH
jgi:hypothetical protein